MGILTKCPNEASLLLYRCYGSVAYLSTDNIAGLFFHTAQLFPHDWQ